MMIDQTLAAKAFPGESAVGKRLLTRINTPEPVWMEVVGVVAHQHESSLAQMGREQIFVTDAYIGNFANNWVLRTSGAPEGYAQQVRAAIASAGSATPDHQSEADGFIGPGSAIRDTIFVVADRRVCGDGGDSRRRGTVWRTLHIGAAANGGDRRSHGFRRSSGGYFPPCGGAGNDIESWLGWRWVSRQHYYSQGQ